VQIGTLLNGITNVSVWRGAGVTTVVSTGPGTMLATGFNGSTDAAVSTAAARGLPKMIHPALPVFFPVVTHCGRSQSLYWTIPNRNLARRPLRSVRSQSAQERCSATATTTVRLE